MKPNYIRALGQYMCQKRRFPDERAAKKELKRARKMGVNEVYECKLCGHWHLTKMRTYKPTTPSV